MKYIKIISLLSIAFVSCNRDVLNKKEINVHADKNLEVLFTIFNQTWTPFLDKDATEHMIEHSKLMQRNYDAFKGYKDHRAIQLTKDLLGRSGTDFFLFAFYYDSFPNSKRIKKIPEIILTEINPEHELALVEIDTLMNEISKFYQEADFDSFYNENQYVYKKAVAEVTTNLPKNDFIAFMEDYFGQKYNSYQFVVIPFFKSEFGMAAQVVDQNIVDNISFISSFEPAVIDAQGRVEYVGYDNETGILEWIIHEYSHIFFNYPLKKPENLKALEQFEELYEPIKGDPQIASWFSVFGEHIAVAFEVRAAELFGNKERATMILDQHVDWPYLNHFIAQLILYENSREEYPNIDSFMPQLIASCKELK